VHVCLPCICLYRAATDYMIAERNPKGRLVFREFEGYESQNKTVNPDENRANNAGEDLKVPTTMAPNPPSTRVTDTQAGVQRCPLPRFNLGKPM